MSIEDDFKRNVLTDLLAQQSAMASVVQGHRMAAAGWRKFASISVKLPAILGPDANKAAMAGSEAYAKVCDALADQAEVGLNNINSALDGLLK